MQGREVPINGDLRKLRFADGLINPESMILGSYGRVTHKISGLKKSGELCILQCSDAEFNTEKECF